MCLSKSANLNGEFCLCLPQSNTATKLVLKFSPINIENGKAMSTLEHYFLTNKLLKINFNQGCNFELFVKGIYSLGWARKQSGLHRNIYFSTLRIVLTILMLGKCFVLKVDIDGVAFYRFEIFKISSHPFGICPLLFTASNVDKDKQGNILTVWNHQLRNYDWYTQLKAI